MRVLESKGEPWKERVETVRQSRVRSVPERAGGRRGSGGGWTEEQIRREMRDWRTERRNTGNDKENKQEKVEARLDFL